jgi:hypothetical protein
MIVQGYVAVQCDNYQRCGFQGPGYGQSLKKVRLALIERGWHITSKAELCPECAKVAKREAVTARQSMEARIAASVAAAVAVEVRNILRGDR